MTESLGLLTIPAPATDDPIGHPLRQILGDFLASSFNRDMQAAWTAIGGKTKVVERVEVNDPHDNTFHTTKLPALFIYSSEKPHQFSFEGEGVLFRKMWIEVLWIPPPVPQAHRATREPFFTALDGALMRALRDGRTPGYIYPGDTDTLAPTLGSFVQGIAKLSWPLWHEFSSKETTLEIEITGGPDDEAKKAKYPAYQATLMVQEQLVEDDNWITAVNTAENTTTPNFDTDPAEAKLQTYPAPHY